MQSKAPEVSEVPLHKLLAEVLAGDPTDGRFEVQYQPIVRLAGGATVAVEAAASWKHPRVRQVAPAHSLPRQSGQGRRRCWMIAFSTRRVRMPKR